MTDKQSPNQASQAVQCLIGNGIDFKGDLSFSGGLHIDGNVIGNIENKADVPARLTLSREGRIEGNVKTVDAEINGTVNGDVHASGKVILHPQSHVSGNVYYACIEIRRGACINGKLIATHDGESDKPGLLDKLKSA